MAAVSSVHVSASVPLFEVLSGEQKKWAASWNSGDFGTSEGSWNAPTAEPRMDSASRMGYSRSAVASLSPPSAPTRRSSTRPYCRLSSGCEAILGSDPLA